MSLSRRQFAGAASLFLSGCAAKTARVGAPAPAARVARVRLAPVKAAADRVIRVVTGLRPFRPSGFVVRAENAGEKIVVHNYGHGGAGITLSWGTSQLAVDEAIKAGMTGGECAVIGCGVAGLSTARLLQMRGFIPTIYTKDMPPLTTSNIAGGYWEPVTLYDTDRVTPEFRRQFGEAARFAYRRYQLLAGDYYGVRWLPAYSFAQAEPGAPAPPPNPNNPMRDIADLHPEAKQLTPEENPFRQPGTSRHQAMLIEPSIYLNALIRDYELAGGKIVLREFADRRAVM
ncbi:MAG: FAD-dependent oxidoreductase, partial [Acidobacteriota bacterium]|nr:FAD-dependent oxidoreductase [Acidobacteriota bacterium]